MLGAIGQSARSTDRAALFTDRAVLLKYLLVAQQSVYRATIGRSRNNRSIAQHSETNMRDQPIVREWLGAIGRLCRNGFARSADCAGIVLRDQPIVQELFGAIGRRAGAEFIDHGGINLLILENNLFLHAQM